MRETRRVNAQGIIAPEGTLGGGNLQLNPLGRTTYLGLSSIQGQAGNDERRW